MSWSARAPAAARVAARLAEAGRKVVLLEAGGDPRELPARRRGIEPDGNRLPDDYDVPAFHPFASENEALRWDFFVRHYDDDARQRATRSTARLDGRRRRRALSARRHARRLHRAQRDDPRRPARRRLGRHRRADRRPLLARRATCGGYFQRLENCRHRPVYRLARRARHRSRRGHGWDGWLHTEKRGPPARLPTTGAGQGDRSSPRAGRSRDVAAADHAAVRGSSQSTADPNDRRRGAGATRWASRYTPLTTRDHAADRHRASGCSTSPRRHPDRLRIELDALATRVLFDGSDRAVGVEYLKGERLYRAHAQPSAAAGERREVRASAEVILAGGAFNTPQLLMLSGHRAARGAGARTASRCASTCPASAATSRTATRSASSTGWRFDHWEVLDGARFARGRSAVPGVGGPAARQLYATNGAVLGVIARSAPERPLPDLFCLALLGAFEGYYPGYSQRDRRAAQLSDAGRSSRRTPATAPATCPLRSADPRDPPQVNFRYFEEGSDAAGEDLDVGRRRHPARPPHRRARSSARGSIAEEELPGEHVRTRRRAARPSSATHAWGHHASCTLPDRAARAGRRARLATSACTARAGLRVVDASVFPRIPGFFIASAVYMVGEKAADVILGAAARLTMPRRA